MKILSWVSCVVNLVKKRASRDGGKVLWNWPHVAVWETYVASWLETQPGNISQIKGLPPHQKAGIKSKQQIIHNQYYCGQKQ